MKESVKFEDIRENEQRQREQYRVALESLSGFSRLSEDQRRYILNSLYLQQRAERGTDPVSASRIKKVPDEFEQFAPGKAYISNDGVSALHEPVYEDNGNRYFPSQLYIMNEFCHQAIDKLEAYREGETLNSSWFEARSINSYSDLEELIALCEKENSPPFIIRVLSRGFWGRGSKIVHTTLLLGRNKESELMVWEKSGLHMPFQLAPLKEVYKAYSPYTSWQTRPLSV